MSGYRERIYRAYLTGALRDVAPFDRAGLSARRPILVHFIRATFPGERTARIADLGCGYGALLEAARSVGYEDAVGVDGSGEQVAAARRLGIESVIEGDVLAFLRERLPASLDVIVAWDLIEHLTRDELLNLLDLARRALAPGGRLVVHTVNAASPFSGRVRYGDLTHEQAFTTTSLAQALHAAGFRSVRFLEDAPIAHTLKGAVRAALWVLVRSMLKAALVVETGDHRDIVTQNLVAVAEV